MGVRLFICDGNQLFPLSGFQCRSWPPIWAVQHCSIGALGTFVIARTRLNYARVDYRWVTYTRKVIGEILRRPARKDGK